MALNPATVGVVVSLYAMGWLALHKTEIAWRATLLGPVPIGIVVISGVGVISSVWALSPDLAIARAWKLLLVMTPLALLVRHCAAGDRSNHAYGRALLIGLTAAAALVTLQLYGDFLLRVSLTHGKSVLVAIKLNVPIAALAVLIWCLPLCLVESSRTLRWSIVGGIAVGLTALAVSAGDGLAPRLALIIGGITWLAAYARPRVTVIAAALAIVAIHVTMLTFTHSLYRNPELSTQITDRSILHRIDVWDAVGTLIRERPLLGYGFDNSRGIPPRAEISTVTGKPRAIPMYPHNVLLQAQLELGVIGVGGFYGCLFYLLWCAYSLHRLARASALAMIAATLSIWCVGYPLWRSTWIAWLAFCAIAISVLANSTRPDRR